MKTVLKGLCAFILAVLLLTMMYVHFKSDDLSGRVLSMLKNELATDLQVAEFDMDMLSGFPHIRFDARDVILAGKGESALIRTQQIRLTVSLFSLFSDAIAFRKLVLKNGTIHVERLKEGTLSLEVLKEGQKKDSPGPSLTFRKVVLENVDVNYVDPGAKQEYLVHFVNGELRGKYAFQNLQFTVSGDVLYQRAHIASSTFLNGAGGSISGKISLDLKEQLYEFKDLELEIGEMQYSVDGTIRGSDEYQHVDLNIRQPRGELHSFLALLPGTYRDELPFGAVHGDFVAEGFIKGRINGKENPQVHFDLALNGATLESRSGKGALRNVIMKGSFSNGPFRRLSSAELDLVSITGNTHGQKFNATLKFVDFVDPVLHSTFDGALPASFVFDYTGISEKLRNASGSLDFHNIEIGPVRLSHIDFTDVSKCSGRSTLNNVEMQMAHSLFRIPSGELVLNGDSLDINNLRIIRDKDDVTVNGALSSLGDALEGQDPAHLNYNLVAQAGSLNISKWFPELAANATDDLRPQVRPVTFTGPAPVRLPQGHLALTADETQYNALNAKRVSLDAFTQTHHVTFDITGDVTGGAVIVHGDLKIHDGYQLSVKIEGRDMDVHECFDQCGNFGQDIVRHEHIRGRSDIKVLADVFWETNGWFNKDKVQAVAGVSIRDGELLKFQMLEDFSDYVHVEDLGHIRFARLDNFIEVRNGNLYIPAMFIQCNAVNLVVNGIHSLDNRILYNIKLNAGQVMSAKLKKHNPLLTPLPARREGTFNMHFTIAGTTSDFEYEMNKNAAESSFAQSAELRERIRERLRAAFGEAIDLIEPPEWETIPEYDLERPGEERFLDVIE